MNKWSIHIEKTNSIHVLIYLIALNIIWTIGITLSNHFTISITDPVVIVLICSFLWSTCCSIFGIESYPQYPSNILVHIVGSIVISTFILVYISNL